MVSDQKIMQLLEQGFGPAAIKRLHDVPEARTMALMPPPGTVSENDIETDYDEALDAATPEAIAALRRIMSNGKSDAAIVSAANAILDRAKGKPVQTTHIDQRVSYNIVSAIPAAPNSKRLEHDRQEIIDIDAN